MKTNSQWTAGSGARKEEGILMSETLTGGARCRSLRRESDIHSPRRNFRSGRVSETTERKGRTRTLRRQSKKEDRAQKVRGFLTGSEPRAAGRRRRRDCRTRRREGRTGSPNTAKKEGKLEALERRREGDMDGDENRRRVTDISLELPSLSPVTMGRKKVAPALSRNFSAATEATGFLTSSGHLLSA